MIYQSLVPSKLSTQSLCFAKQIQGSPYQATFRDFKTIAIVSDCKMLKPVGHFAFSQKVASAASSLHGSAPFPLCASFSVASFLAISRRRWSWCTFWVENPGSAAEWVPIACSCLFHVFRPTEERMNGLLRVWGRWVFGEGRNGSD